MKILPLAIFVSLSCVMSTFLAWGNILFMKTLLIVDMAMVSTSVIIIALFARKFGSLMGYAKVGVSEQ